MEPSIIHQPSKSEIQTRNRDIGSVSKKKKERENRNSVSSCDLVHEWVDKQDFITVTLFLGSGHDDHSVSTVTEDQQLVVSLADGRNFQVQLYDKVKKEDTSISFKGHKCIIKLMKQTPTQWPSLEKQIDSRKKSPTPKPKDIKIGNDNQELAKKISIIKLNSVKTDMVERSTDANLSLFLYITHHRSNTVEVHFSPTLITVRYSTSDSNFLKIHEATDDSIFEWSVKPKYEILVDQCSYKVNSYTIEIKIKKVVSQLWCTISAIDNSVEKAAVKKNTWVFVGKTPDVSKNSSIPTAPPPPAVHEAKKPTCLVAPAAGASSSTKAISNYLLSPLGADGGSSSLTCPKGLSGLDNIGNTCFMNSVLQCLLNTRELRDYFQEPNFQQDLNKDNPLGMGGKLAISFAILMKQMWSRTMRTYAPSKLKGVMSMKANQFSGFAQHDAQEFMVELLDGLHEDLNRVKKKPYIAEPPDLDGWTDHDAAEESWRLHKLRNDSIIDDLFKGQFKSTLRCHECSKISVKFDEFCCLSVPIPKDQKTIQIVFFWRNTSQQPKKFFIRLSADAVVEDLKLQLSNRTNIHPSAIQVMEAGKYKIHKLFARGSSLSSVVPSELLMAFEIMTQHQVGEPVIELAVTQRMLIPNPPSKCASCSRVPPVPNTKLKRCTKCYRAGYCDTTCQKSHWANHKAHCKLVPEPIGSPFILSIAESKATYSNLSRIAENYARFSVDVFQPPIAQTTRRRAGSTSSGEISSEGEEMEVDNDEVAGKSGSSYCGEDRAEADWPLESNEGARGHRQRRSSSISSSSGGEDIPQLSSSPKGRISQHPHKTLATPATRLFTLRPVNSRALNLSSPNGDTITDRGDDILNLKDVHYLAMDWCTNERLPVHCFIQNKQIDCEVEIDQSVQTNRHTSLEACMDLFTKSENLSEDDSWRCPRCKKPVEATKQMSIWRLPTILIVQLKRFSFKYVLYSDKIDKFVEYPDKNFDVKAFLSEGSKDSPTIYDLYGVINHMGRLLGGHYTAYCRTVDPNDSSESEIDWRLCDDSRVNFINSSRVVHDQAYLLLYRRRGVDFNLELPLSQPQEESKEVTKESGLNCSETPMDVSFAEVKSSGCDPPSTVQDELD